jgi:predicted transcriptional regulator
MRRSKYDIIADILKLCQDDASITEVIYKSNLNHKVGKSYLAVLMEAGFVVKLDERYHTTWLGTQFLRRFGELQEVFNQKPKLLCGMYPPVH